MSIRSNAITWLSTHHKNASGIVVTTKYYTPEQSWPKKHVWWPTVSKQKIETTADKYINIVCEKLPASNDFYYLKVPVMFFKDHLKEFHIVKSKTISMYLSADKNNLFEEIRGTGKLDFSQFLIST